MEKSRLADLAFYLHQLKDPEVFEEIEAAISRIDKGAILRKMEEMRIPAKYVPALLTVIFTYAYIPMQKWPPNDP